jgi:hypothetical protein
MNSELIIEIDEGADGLFGIRVTDPVTGVIWWETICETKEDAVEAVKSLFEPVNKKRLQKQLTLVHCSKK